MSAHPAELTPTEYMSHHLSFQTMNVGGYTINIDTLATTVFLAIVTFGFLWWIVRGATAGVPNRRQAFVEMMFDFIGGQAQGIFTHGDANKFVAPLAFTVGLLVLVLNSMDFLPIDVMSKFYEHVLGQEHWRGVPTADINTTFALAITVWLLMLFFSVKVKGLGGWIHELFCAPFGSFFLLWPFNFAFNLIEYVSKPLSHSLRLFGNMYAGELIFLLLGMLASIGWFGAFWAAIFSTLWALFHILIVGLQAYIFMMLTIVYITMAHEHH